MTNWKSGSTLLACVLGLGLAACGDGGKNKDDAGMDATVQMDATTDAPIDSTVPPPNPAKIRLAMLPANFLVPDGDGGFDPQQFDVCIIPGGSGSVRIMATAAFDENMVATGEQPLPSGAVTQHVFPAAQLETACGFPANATCLAQIYKTEDVTFGTLAGTPICNVVGNAQPVASTSITPTTFVGADAYTVAFFGDAAVPASLAINIFEDEIVATDNTKARVRVVNADPDSANDFMGAPLELCYNRIMPDEDLTLLGDANSSAFKLNPVGMRSAYYDVDPLAPQAGPIPVSFAISLATPDGEGGFDHCVAPQIPATVWPPSGGAEQIYAQYQAGVSSGGAMPVTSLEAGQVVTFYLLRIPTGMADPATTVIALPLLDSAIPAPPP